MIALACLAASAIAPQTAAACSCLATPLYEINPKNGATDVALNAAPIVEGVFAAGSVSVEDETGRLVDITVNEGPWPGCAGTWAEIIPKKSWQPRTTYIIRVKPLYPDAVKAEDAQSAFTTGDTALDLQPLAAPTARMSALKDVPDMGGCGSNHVITCINVDGQTEDSRDVELIARRDGKIVLRSLLPINDVDYGFDALPDCIELRHRGPTGLRSEPLVFCGEEAQRVSPWVQPPERGLWTPICRDGSIAVEKLATTHVTIGDGGVELDDGAAHDDGAVPHHDAKPAPKRPSGSADERSDASTAPDASLSTTDASAAPAQHRSYGCAMFPGTEQARGTALVLFFAACAYVGRRRRPS